MLAHERLLGVLPPLVGLLPQGGLRRGSIVVSGGGAGMSLAFALAAGPSRAGAWVGVVGLPSVGLAAAEELGVSLGRVFLVAEPPARQWAEVTAAVAEGAEVVLARAPSPQAVRPVDVRRVQARLAHRGAVLLLVEPSSTPFSPDLEFTTTPLNWEGIGNGHGRLLARRVRVELDGRRAGRPIRRELWLPGPDGAVAEVAAPAVRLHPKAG